MRRRSWSSDLGRLGFLAIGVGLCACKSKSAPAEITALTASASVPVASASAAPPAIVDAGAQDASAPTGDALVKNRTSDAGPDFAAGECPSFDPDKWTAYTQMPAEDGCWLFTPTAKDKLPQLTWEPCGRDGFGAKCRKIKFAPGERIVSHDQDSRMVDVEGQGPGRISIVTGCAALTSRLFMVADLDGPVTGALGFDPSWQCDTRPGMRSSGWGADLQFNDPHPSGNQNEWDGTPRLFASVTAARGQISPTKHDGALDDEPLRAAPDLRFWKKLPKSAAESAAIGIPAGIKPEVQVGTDGTDVVWSVGDRAAGDAGTCSVFTGAWTANPSNVVGTHLVDLSCVEAKEWKVRCGHAMTMTGEEQGLLLRLKDGMVFRFPKLSAPLDRGRMTETLPLDMSCKELFLRVGGPIPNVFRVPLDALPEGTRPGQPPAPIAGSASIDAGAPTPAKDAGAGTDAGAGDGGR